MISRTSLVAAIAGMLLIALVVAIVPFLQSMNPTARAYNDLPRIKLTGLAPGDYRLADYLPQHTAPGDWTIKAFVYKKHSGEINVWRLPARNGAVGMPDLSWWRPLFECRNFGPTVVNGIVDETGPITCHDDKVSDYWRREWRWTIDGKNLGKMVEDLDPVFGSVQGEFFVVRNGN